ncbi:MAG: translation initiation factor IF-3 [Candidatus Atribacteria bacterium]|nr:translation initiation factor IF-3 [Candidatus Atribacteria bacterium]MBE3093263.1 translation initiation factor IF-3 [Chloroflexota bacterium]
MKSTTKLRINEEIKAEKIRLIDFEGKQVGVVSKKEGLELAEKSNLDLVEVAPEAKPPVCRIIDYGKYKYLLDKKNKTGKKKQKSGGMKEIKMRPNIGEHDYNFKVKNLCKFLEEGNQVKITIMFKGREMNYVDLGRKLLERIIEDTNEIAKVLKEPKLEGRNMTLVLMPK